MTTEIESTPQEWPAPLSAGGGGLSLGAIILTAFLTCVVVTLGAFYGELFGSKQQVEAQTTSASPAPTAPPVPPVAAEPGDMFTLGPQFGEWLVKHPEYTDRINALQAMMDDNRRAMQNTCATIKNMCAHPSAQIVSSGVCKTRPTQCSQ